MKTFSFAICFFIIMVCSCGSRPFSSQLNSEEDDFAATAASFWTWAMENNDSCFLDIGGAHTGECGTFITRLNEFGDNLYQYIDAVCQRELAGVTDPDEYIKRRREIRNRINTAVYEGAAKIFTVEGGEQRVIDFINIVAKSDFRNLSQIRPAAVLNNEGLWWLYKDETIMNYLRNMEIDPDKVRYNGETAALEFSDPDLERDVNYLTLALIIAAPKVKKAFFELDEGRREFWTADDNTIGGDSRVEPFDVLSLKFKHIFMNNDWDAGSSNNINPITLKKVIDVGLKKFFGLSNYDEGYELYAFRKPNSPISMESMFFCASDQYIRIAPPEQIGDLVGSNTSVIQKLPLDDYYIKDLEKGYQLKCADKIYSFDEEVIGGGTVIERPGLNFQRKIKVLMSTALVNEMNNQALAGAVTYLRSKGYRIQKNPLGSEVKFGKKINDLKSDFLKEALDADMYIPVSHSTMLDDVQLGVSSAIKIIATKRIWKKNGGWSDLELVFYVPPIGGSASHQMVRLKDHDLAQLFRDRRAIRTSPFILLNISCYSEATLDIWMRAFRMSLPENPGEISEIRDAPIVIGSKVGFSTDTTIQILSHFEYPLGVIKRLGQGKELDEIMSFLQNPPQSFQREFLEFAQRWTTLVNQSGFRLRQLLDFDYWRNSDTGFAESFEPVINLDFDYYWDGTSRIDMIFQNISNPDDRKVF